jgi:hypothetical protein
MPPRNSPQSAQTEGRIALAIQAFQKGQFRSLKAATDAYDVPYSTTYTRIKGTVARRDLQPPNLKLTQYEELSLKQWILSMDECGLSPRIDTVRRMANLLLQKRDNTSPVFNALIPTVGKNWVYKFIQRHDPLKSRFNRKYDHQRAKCEDPTIIRDWFRLVQNTRAKYGIVDEDIYNFDETGFQMGVITTARVVTGSERRASRPVTLQPGNREWVTVIECICAHGWSLPPMVIFEGKLHQSTWYSEQLPSNWSIGVSENGWTNDSLGLSWLVDIFEKHTKGRTVGKYRLLILDGHGSHNTPEFDLFCSEHSIITLCMPPHSSHLLQPLDVTCFAAVKRAYGRRVENYMRVGLNHIDKPDFITTYYETRQETIVTSNIQSGFTATGLVPHNPDRVLEKLHVTLRTPTPPIQSQFSSPWKPETPHNIREVERQTRAIKAFIRRRTQSPPSPTDLALNQLVKGCQMAMHNAVLLSEENRQLRTENERQKKKRTKRRSYIATGGVLTIQEGLSRSQAIEEVIEEVIGQPSEVRRRAPNKCSMCKSLEHTARTCPTKFSSN